MSINSDGRQYFYYGNFLIPGVENLRGSVELYTNHAWLWKSIPNYLSDLKNGAAENVVTDKRPPFPQLPVKLMLVLTDESNGRVQLINVKCLELLENKRGCIGLVRE